MELREIFRKVVKDKNLITPNIVTFGKVGKFVYEISEGLGMDNKAIFGVTVVNTETMTMDSKLSKLCQSMDEVEQYVCTFDKL